MYMCMYICMYICTYVYKSVCCLCAVSWGDQEAVLELNGPGVRISSEAPDVQPSNS